MGSIYLVQGDGELAEMTEEAYDTEDLLQELLAKYPNLLAGDQVNPEKPRRWLLISREAGVPDEEGGSDRWSVDHLFLDQDGIPTLVEVKRSGDTRIRREVVGQMLDYAANAVVYWPVEEMRARFEAGLEAEGRDSQEMLVEVLGDEVDEEELWQTVKTNLRAGKVRLLFVADEIPTELRRIVEFLNGQMDPAEVLAVEIKRFVGEGRTTLVPKVVGQAAEASTKRGGPGTRWDEPRFLAALRETASTEELAVAIDLLRFAQEVTARQVDWGMGKSWGTFTARLLAGKQRLSLFSVYTTREFTVNFGWSESKLGERGSDISEKYRDLTKTRLGLAFQRKTWVQGWPTAKLAKLVDDGAATLKQLVREYVAEVSALAEAED